MPLWLLGTIVVVGLAAIWIIMRVFGFNRTLTLTHELAAEEFATDNPGLVPEDIILAKSGKSALIHAGGSTYLLWVMGVDVATQNLAKARVADAPDGLTLRLPDFAAPRVSLTLTPDEKSTWKLMIEGAA